MKELELKTTSELKKELYNYKKIMSELEAKLKHIENKSERSGNDIYEYGKTEEKIKEIKEILLDLEKEMMKRETKKIILKDNYSKELEIKLSYMLNLLNSNHFTKGNHDMLLLLESLGFSQDEITFFVQSKWSKPVIDEFMKREELVNKNKERSLYLKRKFKKVIKED